VIAISLKHDKTECLIQYCFLRMHAVVN